MSKHRTSNGFSPTRKFVFPCEIYFARLLFVASCCRFLKTSRNVFIFTHMLGLLTNNNRRWFKSSSVCLWFILHFFSHWAAKIFITVGTSDASDHFTSLVETETFSWNVRRRRLDAIEAKRRRRKCEHDERSTAIVIHTCKRTLVIHVSCRLRSHCFRHCSIFVHNQRSVDESPFETRRNLKIKRFN